MGRSSSPTRVTGRTWGEKGKAPVVRRSGARVSVNAISAISTKGRMHFMVSTESFTVEVMCRFFRRRQRQPHFVRAYFGGPHVPVSLPAGVQRASVLHQDCRRSAVAVLNNRQNTEC
ncbi:hypothetical protein [Streptomyces sp. Je 1-332]|uniref:hypothetical protein n=1 Tax=Streptomyces sp. Je 1-332 TaxID=3231270 RepID=UPI00345A7F7F